jgi:N-acetylglucosaminyl-diphospho-decaprenol L-rhamnosyltransferase
MNAMTSSGFSAIVVSYHTGAILHACLDALSRDAACAEIILVNNGNPRAMEDALQTWSCSGQGRTLLQGHGNIGFGRACNLGAEHATQAHLVFVNPDAVIAPGALRELESCLRHPLDLAGGLVLDAAGNEQRGARRGELTLLSALVSFTGIAKPGQDAGWRRDFNRNREPLPESPVEVPTVSGAFFAMRTEGFRRVGGFDPGYFLHVEDIDLCDRVRAHAGRVWFVPAARAVHQGGTSDSPAWRVEGAKIAAFLRFFWRRADWVGGYLSVCLFAPVIVCGVVLRVLFRGKRVKQ